VEKYDLIVLALGNESVLLESSGQELIKLKQEFASENATMIVIFVGVAINRVISGQQICEIDALPCFDDSKGRQDAVPAIQSWVYEAQANIHSGSSPNVKTAIFVDVSDDIRKLRKIEPLKIVGSLESTDFYNIVQHEDTHSFEKFEISRISKLEALAKSGSEKAMYELGLAYEKGDGVVIDRPKAQMLLYKSYLRGNIDAIFAIIDLFEDLDMHFYKEAARHGHLNAAAVIDSRSNS
jgi:hypothetical protein